MEDFIFCNNTRIIFGKKAEQQVGKCCAAYSGKVLLHYGGKSAIKSGLYDRIKNSLRSESIEVYELGNVSPNPRLSLVREGISICREKNIGLILAVGGGSVIDSAKAIAMGVKYDGDVWELFCGSNTPSVIPVGVVLTIPASGSETSTASVITNEDGLLKRMAFHEDARPKFALMNPELTFSLSQYQTACGIADIMSHVMERYFTSTRNVDLTDRLCEATMKSVIHNTSKVLDEPKSYDARAEIMWAGTIAHNDILSTGRMGDWATHMIEHELSGIYDIAHGAGLAVLFPAWMKYVYKRDIKRFIQFAERVWNVKGDICTPEACALEGINRVKDFFSGLGMPVSLSELNITGESFGIMAKKAVQYGYIGNFMKLGADDIKKIFELAM